MKYSEGKKFKARPQTELYNIKDQVTEYANNIRIFTFCGGLGGGDCVNPAGQTYVIWPFKVDKHITYIRQLTFHNPEFTGLRFYTDAGADIFCAHNIGSEKTFYMGLSASPSDDPETVARAGTSLSGALPYDIVFNAEKCPQPSDPAWEAIVYVYVWWGDSTFVNEGSAFHDFTNPLISLTKNDNEKSI